MRLLVLAWIVLAAALISARAGPTEQAIIAAMRLAERPNYTWQTSVEDNAGSHLIEGRTDGAGRTWLRMPMIPVVRRRLGLERDEPLELLFQGKQVHLLRLNHEWRAPGDLLAAAANAPSTQRAPTMVRGSASIGAFGSASVAPRTVTPLLAPDASRRYSSTHVSLSHPHEELAIIVSCATSMAVAGDLVSGELSETGAMLLLVRDEQADVSPLAATGAFKFWIRNGAVVKYHLKLDGTLAVQRRQIPVRVSTTTVLSALGATRVPQPEAESTVARR